MQSPISVLVVATNAAVRQTLNLVLSQRGFVVQMASSFAAAGPFLNTHSYKFVFLQARIGRQNVLELLPLLRARLPGALFILIGRQSANGVLAAFRAGVDSYLPLPLRAEEISSELARLEQKAAAQVERDTQFYQRGQRDERAATMDQIQIESLGMMSRLAANLAHEINNPLTPIIGLAEMMCEEPNVEPSLRAALQTILTSARRIAIIVQNLMGFTRPITLQEQLDVRDIVTELVRSVERRLIDQMITLRMKLPQEPVELIGSIAALKQAFFILVEYSRESMPDGGTLTIQLETVPLAASKQRRQAVLQIIDTARPIPASHIPHMFEPFYAHTVQGASAGPGLAVAYRIIHLHSGAISVEAHEIRGNIFRVVLPM
jgi:signal transduction histidine kinase